MKIRSQKKRRSKNRAQRTKKSSEGYVEYTCIKVKGVKGFMRDISEYTDVVE